MKLITCTVPDHAKFVILKRPRELIISMLRFHNKLLLGMSN